MKTITELGMKRLVTGMEIILEEKISKDMADKYENEVMLTMDSKKIEELAAIKIVLLVAAGNDFENELFVQAWKKVKKINDAKADDNIPVFYRVFTIIGIISLIIFAIAGVRNFLH